MDRPNTDGKWNFIDHHGHSWHEIDVYIGPNGDLSIWGPDIGAHDVEQTLTDGDEMCGHLPAWAQGTDWVRING